MARLRTDFDTTHRTLTLQPQGRLDVEAAEVARSFAEHLVDGYDVLVVDGSAVAGADDGALAPLAEVAARLRPLGVVFAFRRLSASMAQAVDESALFGPSTVNVIDLRGAAAARAG